MSARIYLIAATLAFLGATPVYGEPDIPVGKEFTVVKDSVLCTSSESLFLLFEGAYLANKTGGKPAFQSYFTNAVQTLAQEGICMLNEKDIAVEITGINVHRNVVKGPLGNKVYAGFEHPVQKRLMYANAESVPGLLDHLSTLTKQKPSPGTTQP